jgi:putative transposon-encoded protein
MQRRTNVMPRLIPALVSLVLVGGFSYAHHSPATYDLTITDFGVTGKIKSLEFRNPHSEMVLQAPDKTGKIVDWEVEFSSVNLLVRRGWKFERIKPGDTVTCIGNPAKTGEPKMYMWSIKLADGTVFAK